MGGRRASADEYGQGPLVFGSWRVGDLKKWGLRVVAAAFTVIVFIVLFALTRNAQQKEEDKINKTSVYVDKNLLDEKMLPASCKKQKSSDDIKEAPLAPRVSLVTPPLSTLAKNNKVEGPLVFRGPYPFNTQTGGLRFDELVEGFNQVLRFPADDEEKDKPRKQETRRRLDSSELVDILLPEHFKLRLISLLNKEINPQETCMVEILDMYDTLTTKEKTSLIDGKIIRWSLNGLSSPVEDPFALTNKDRNDKINFYTKRIQKEDDLFVKINQLKSFADEKPKTKQEIHITYIFDNQGEARSGLIQGAYQLSHGKGEFDLKTIWAELQLGGAKPDTKWQYELEWFCLALQNPTLTKLSTRSSDHKISCTDINPENKNHQHRNKNQHKSPTPDSIESPTTKPATATKQPTNRPPPSPPKNGIRHLRRPTAFPYQLRRAVKDGC